MSPPQPVRSFSGIVLTGGTGQRLGGVDKSRLRVGGIPLLQRALAALREADTIVVVGPEQPLAVPVRWTREAPAGGGPAAGLLAGVAALPRDTEWVAVLAVDMPFADDRTFARLAAAATADGALLTDPDGRAQYLCAVYRRAALESAAETCGDPNGLPVRRLVDSLQLTSVGAAGSEAADLDLPTDLELTDDGPS